MIRQLVPFFTTRLRYPVFVLLPWTLLAIGPPPLPATRFNPTLHGLRMSVGEWDLNAALPARKVRNENPMILSGPEIREAMPKILVAGQAHFAAQAMYLIVHLGVPDALGGDKLTIPEIVSRVGAVNEDVLLRAMRYLSCVPGLFIESSRGGLCEFSLTPMGALLQTGAAQPSMACGILHWVDPVMMRAMAATTHYAISTSSGPIFDHVHGMSVFECFSKYPNSGDPFNEFMTFFSMPEVGVVTDSYDWAAFKDKTVVDVGGSLGTVMGALKAKYPEIKTVNFELPAVVASVSERPDGVEFVAGDMFLPQTIPKVDGAIFMKHILHDWSDAKAKEILLSCKQALLPGAKVIIVDAVIEDVGKVSDLKAQQLSIHWLMKLFDGKERDGSEWRSLAESAGFTVDSIQMTPFPPNCQFITLSPS